MKKYVFTILSMSLLILSSCLSDNSPFVLTKNTNEITFGDPFTQKNLNRALSDISNANLKESSFKVWGSYEEGSNSSIPVFNGTEVYSTNGLWVYDNPVKWEMDKTYKFAALAPTDVIPSGTYTYGYNGFTITNIPLSIEAEKGIDYLVSDLVETDYTNSGSTGVQLDFKHIMSRLKVSLKYDSEDTNLLGVTINELSIKLPSGTAKYEQVNPSGPSSEDIWTWPSDISYTTYDLITESYKASSSYQSIKDGFFLVPMGYDIDAKMDISYTIELKVNDEVNTMDFTKTDIALNQLSSFTQGYITNLMLNVKPTGSDYAYIEINVSQKVDEHHEDNGYIDDKGRAFTIENLSQKGEKLLAYINGLGNDPLSTHYSLISIVDNEGNEQLSDSNELEYLGEKDGCSEFSTGLNALLEADQEYTFTISDHKGNEQKLAYTVTSRMGGASMIWTIEIPTTSKTKALNIPVNTSGTLPFTVRIDWGDESESLILKGSSLSVSDSFYHVYEVAGTYDVTITSGVADYSKQQFLSFSFYSNRRSPNYNELGSSDYSSSRLVEIKTPLLNLGVANPSNLFRGCTSLKKIPKNLFIYNTQITHLLNTFQQTSLEEIPKGLLDPLVDLQQLKETFRKITTITSIPSGLLASQKKAYIFYYCFYGCTNAKLNSKIFITNESENETRFGDLTQPVDFTNIFSYCEAGGTVPELWDYTYGAGFTWMRNDNNSPFSNISNITSFTNYSDIPEKWIKSHPSTDDGWVSYPY